MGRERRVRLEWGVKDVGMGGRLEEAAAKLERLDALSASLELLHQEKQVHPSPLPSYVVIYLGTPIW